VDQQTRSQPLHSSAARAGRPRGYIDGKVALDKSKRLKFSAAVPQRGHGLEVFVGFDAEWVLEGSTRNRILSHQYYLICGDKVHCKVFYATGPRRSQRPRLNKCVTKLIIEAIKLGVLQDWPRRVTIAGFFLRADLAACGDLDTFSDQVDSANGRATTIERDALLEADLDACDLDRISARVLNKRNLDVYHRGHRYQLRIRFIDVASHAPPGTSLLQLGALLKLPKVSLPKGHSIERMDALLADNKKAFEKYGLRDAEIAVRYLLRLRRFASKELGIPKLPPTASSLGVSYFLKTLEDNGVDFDTTFSVTESASEVWSEHTGAVRTIKKKVPTPMRSFHEELARRCFHGGRNEDYFCGPTPVSNFGDFDLISAYIIALLDLRHIDYSRARTTTNAEDFVGHVLGFAYVDFEFPPETRYPCLPVDVGSRGLYFPLKGSSYCPAPEIAVALSMGCKITIHHGVIIPWREGDARIFEIFSQKIRRLREKFKKRPLDNKYAKLVGNGLYGKIAQGIKPKNVFNPRNQSSEVVPPSKISHAAMAAHATGFVRAVVSELLASIPPRRTVVSATTDGILTDATPDELRTDGPMASRYKALCARVSGDGKMIELKGQALQIIGMRTRGQLTAIRSPGMDAILAKSSVSPDPKWERSAYNEHMIDLYLGRKPGDLNVTRPFLSMRTQWSKGADVIRLLRKVRLNLEYDFKRRPVNPKVVTACGREHLAFDTAPWRTAEEGSRARAIFDGWRRRRCLKTMDDWYDWDEHYQFTILRDRIKRERLRGLNAKRDSSGVVDVARRVFLRAFAQSAFGLTKTMPYPELAAWLTSKGYSTNSNDLRTAKREVLIGGALPHTRRVLDFLGVVSKEFPTLQIDKLLCSQS
jgi:hypothetical protein